jgi:hypothetical protein
MSSNIFFSRWGYVIVITSYVDHGCSVAEGQKYSVLFGGGYISPPVVNVNEPKGTDLFYWL